MSPKSAIKEYSQEGAGKSCLRNGENVETGHPRQTHGDIYII
jgi:hypothetical protein